jgi:antirestriction protein ArdC
MSRHTVRVPAGDDRASLYTEITDKIIAELEAGRIPWVQPWGTAAIKAPLAMPRNAATLRGYSGINVLILWGAVFEHGFSGQSWLTFRQALGLGGHVRKGERGTTVVYADRFTPDDERRRAAEAGEEPGAIAFLKRFTVFNTDQCGGLPEEVAASVVPPPPGQIEPRAEALIAATGADFRIGGARAYYNTTGDFVQVPPPAAYFEPINWHRTAFHELGHYADLRIMPRRCRSCGQVSRVLARHVGIIGLTEQAVVVPGSESNGTGILGEACGRSARVFLAAVSLPDYRGDFRSWERTGRARCGGTIHACDPNRAWHAARRIQMIRPWLRRVDALSRSSINSANPDRYLPRPIAKATETRTCKTLPDGQPSSPEQHQASD